MTATIVVFGAISFRNWSHFALMPNSNCVNPVTLPPVRTRRDDDIDVQADELGCDLGKAFAVPTCLAHMSKRHCS